MPRKTGKIKSNTTILLVVEGITEQIYFSEMRTLERNPGVTVIPKMAKHSDIYHILDTAITEIKSGAYDSVWCVFDRDTLLINKITKELKSKISDAERYGIKFADSFPAFEIWFLLHYKIPKQIYNNQNEVINELKKYISDYSKEKQWFDNKKLYAFLKDKLSIAINNSKLLEDKNEQIDSENKSICNVYKVVKDILGSKTV